MTHRTKILFVILLLAVGVVGRTMPHIWNFAPIAAIGIVSARYLGARYALVLPLVALFLGDIIIGFYDTTLLLFVYGSFILAGILGILVRKSKSIIPTLSASIVASTQFYLITNWAVWQFGTSYAKTIDGLMTSYILALPFFRATIAGDLFYTIIFVAAFEMALYLKSYKQKQALKYNFLLQK